jgi:hypothetical protein
MFLAEKSAVIWPNEFRKKDMKTIVNAEDFKKRRLFIFKSITMNKLHRNNTQKFLKEKGRFIVSLKSVNYFI